MGSRSSLLRRATIPALAVAATAALTTSLCGPTRAATASLIQCKADPNGFSDIWEQVELSIGPDTQWQKAIFHAKQIGSEPDQPYEKDFTNFYSGDEGGDYDYPADDGYVVLSVTGSGTYTCWCICSGGNSGGAFSASTGGTDSVIL